MSTLTRVWLSVSLISPLIFLWQTVSESVYSTYSILYTCKIQAVAVLCTALSQDECNLTKHQSLCIETLQDLGTCYAAEPFGFALHEPAQKQHIF